MLCGGLISEVLTVNCSCFFGTFQLLPHVQELQDQSKSMEVCLSLSIDSEQWDGIPFRRFLGFFFGFFLPNGRCDRGLVRV